jgi:hypothetical protein
MADCVRRAMRAMRLRHHPFSSLPCASVEMRMINAKYRVSGQTKWLLLIFFTAICGAAPALGQQADTRGQPSAASAGLPDAPQPMAQPAATIATVPGDSEEALAAGTQAQAASQAGTPQATGANQQQSPQKPIGTAAAPPEGAVGITASRPAGAVIAPAKQRRVRTILIRVGLLVGAGVALGTVLALTHATPSRPQ